MNFHSSPNCSYALFILLAMGSTAVAQDEPPLELFRIEASYSPPYYTTVYHPPANPVAGQLKIGANYTLWIPEGLKRVRGIIIHQHGCGSPAALESVTAAHDLHWQELAKKTGCALLAPSYHLPEKLHCRVWTFPREGSGKQLLIALKELADLSGHAEIAAVPWCLWGHSGGGSWSSRMQRDYPERIAAIWFQSGSGYGKEDFDEALVTETLLQIPMMASPAIKEKDYERYAPAWHGTLAMFKDFRARGAPIGFAPDPVTVHETGDSRYLAIPFLEACLKLRLPDQASESLKIIDTNQGWLAPLFSTDMPKPAKDFKGDVKKAVWLPNETVARAWYDFVNTGTVSDSTPPPAPYDVQVDKISGLITWKASVDYESGLQAFIVERDGKEIGQVPEKPLNRYGRPLFQGLSFGDTPERLLQFQFVDTSASIGDDHDYEVIAVNSVGLRSDSVWK